MSPRSSPDAVPATRPLRAGLRHEAALCHEVGTAARVGRGAGGRSRRRSRLRVLGILLVVLWSIVPHAGAAAAESAAATAPLAWTAGPAGPVAVRGPAMAFDPDTGRVVVFGGTHADGSVSGDTWLWDGTAWSRAATGAAGAGGPPPRTGASLAFDGSLHQFILFGGSDGNGGAFADTWAWNGVSWVQQSPATSPPARSGASLAPDAAGDLVLFGGTAPPATSPPATTVPGGPPPSPTVLADTWTWNGSSWQASTTAAPPARTGASMDLDAATGQTVLFGGSPTPDGVAPAGAPLGDTWTFDGTAWTQAAPSTEPPARSGAILSGDPQVGGALLFGGTGIDGVGNDTWSWNGTDWTALAANGTPAARTGAGAAYDGAQPGEVIFGGAGQDGTPLATTALLAPQTPATGPGPTPTTVPPGVTPQPVTGPTTTLAPQSTARPGPTSVPGRSRPAATGTTVPARRPTTPTTLPVRTSPVPPVVVAPPAEPPGVAPPQMVRPGERIVLLGAGFSPYGVVTVTFHSTPQRIGSVRANPQGQASVVVSVPHGAAPGHHHFELSGPGPDGRTMTLLTAVDVLPAVAGPFDFRTPVLLGVAVALPLGTWFALGAWGRRQRGATPP